jgi:hypothetical protein
MGSSPLAVTAITLQGASPGSQNSHFDFLIQPLDIDVLLGGGGQD